MIKNEIRNIIYLFLKKLLFLSGKYINGASIAVIARKYIMCKIFALPAISNSRTIIGIGRSNIINAKIFLKNSVSLFISVYSGKLP